MRALGMCLLCWKLIMVSSDSTTNSPKATLQTTDALEHLEKHKLDPKQMHFDVLENQTLLDGLTIHELETETKLKLELTRLQHRSRWKRCLKCGKKPVTIRSVQTRSRRYTTYLNNRVILLQRTVGKLTLSLKKTKAKIKSYEKWKNSSEMRFEKLENAIQQLQRNRGNSNPAPGILTNDELNFIRSDHRQAGQQGRTPISSTEAINTNSRRKHRKRTRSSNFSMNGNVLNYEEIAKAVVNLNSSFPVYRSILYKLHSRVSRFNRYIIKRQQNLQRLVSSSVNKNDMEIRKIYSKIMDLTDRIESGDFVDSVRNATVERVLDELEPDLSSVLHQSLDDLNSTYHDQIKSLDDRVALNKATLHSWSRRLGSARASNMRMRRNLQKSIDSVRNSTRSKILWQNRRITNVASSISTRMKETEDKIDSISNFVVDTRSHVQNLNQSLKDIDRSSLKGDSESISLLNKNITEIQSKYGVLQQKQAEFQDELKTLVHENLMQRKNVSGPDPVPNSTYVEKPTRLLESSPSGLIEPARLELGQSNVATLQLKLETAIEKRMETRMKAIDGITRDMKQVKADMKVLTESVERVNKTIISDYVTLSQYRDEEKQMEDRIGATVSQRIEEFHKETHNDTTLLENRLLELENTTVISDEVLHQIINSSEILKDQMAKLRFFRAFVFLKLGASKGKNLSQIEAVMDRMRDDIDFNYNTTKLITDYVRDQDNRITRLSDELREVVFLSETVEEQRISLEELNYTLTERQDQMSRLISSIMGAFDTSNDVVRRLRQDLDFMKKNTSNHFIRTFTNLEYLTQILKETNIAVEENSDRLNEVNNTLLYLELSYEEPSDASLDPGFTRPPSDDDGFEEPTRTPVNDEIIDNENISPTIEDQDYFYVFVNNGSDGEASAAYDDYYTTEPRSRFGRSIIKENTNQEIDDSVDRLAETTPQKFAPITGQAAFSVGLTNAFDCCGVVRFNKVFSNRGGRYDVSSGKFTADVAGHYVFYVTMSKRNSFVHAALVSNDISTISIRMEQGSGGYYSQNQSSNSVVLAMDPGDQVWLQTYSGSLIGYPSPSTTFSGFLISE